MRIHCRGGETQQATATDKGRSCFTVSGWWQNPCVWHFRRNRLSVRVPQASVRRRRFVSVATQAKPQRRRSQRRATRANVAVYQAVSREISSLLFPVRRLWNYPRHKRRDFDTELKTETRVRACLCRYLACRTARMQASKRGLLIIQVLLWNWLWSASVAENPPGLCEDLPALTGRDFVALTANTTRLTVERSRHLTADLKIVQVFQDDALLHQETVKVRRVDEAVSCDHQHAVGDYRLWVLKRHSSGNLTAKVSVEVTQTWARAVLHAMTGKELKHLELMHSKTSFLSTFEIACKAQYLLLVCLLCSTRIYNSLSRALFRVRNWDY